MTDRFRYDPGADAETEHDVRSFMEQLARIPPEVNIVPRQDLIWLKARLLRRWEVERRAIVPLDVIEPMQVAAALATTVLALIWWLPSILRFLTP